jgi:hypothetical protein
MVFLAHALLGPFDRQPMIAGEGFHPVLVVGRAPPQHLFVHHRNANHLTEEVNHLLGPRQPAEVTVNDDAVEAVVDEVRITGEVARESGVISPAIPI